MPDYLQELIVAAIVACGVMTGLLFAFSIVVMRALLQLPAAMGLLAMQRINVLIISPLFLLVFLGSSLLCAVVAVISLHAWPDRAAALLLAGALCYLLGPLLTTVVFNVPLNNRLARVAPAAAEEEWPRYGAAWLRWNHVRTLLGAVGTALLALGLARAGVVGG